MTDKELRAHFRETRALIAAAILVPMAASMRAHGDSAWFHIMLIAACFLDAIVNSRRATKCEERGE